MGFLMGSSCVSSSPPRHPRFSSSSFPSRSVLLCSCNAAAFRRSRPPSASLRCEDDYDTVTAKRRVVLLVGVSVLPFLQLRVPAMADARETELRRSNPIQTAELAVKEEASSNLLLSLVNSIGVFTAGILGALYALSRKENEASIETIESMKKRIKEEEAALVSMEKSFEARLEAEEEEGRKELERTKEEQMSLSNRLNSAKDAITELSRELSSEKRSSEELRDQKEDLEKNLSKAKEDKMSLEAQLKEKLDSIKVLEERIKLLGFQLQESEGKAQKISSSLEEKQLELKNINDVYIRTSRELDEVKSEISQLKDELSRNQKELDSKNVAIEELKGRINIIISERDGYMKNLDEVSRDYEALRMDSETREAADAEILVRKGNEIQHLKEELRRASDEINDKDYKIDELNRELEDSTRMNDIEAMNVKSLRHELEVKKKALDAATDRVSHSEKLLDESKEMRLKLESEVSKVRNEFKEAKKLYEKILEEAKRDNEALESEVELEREKVKKANEEIERVTVELKDSHEERDRLKTEVEDACQKAEAMSEVLEMEKKTGLALRQELKEMEDRVLKEKEASTSIEMKLEETVKALDSVNQKTVSLSREIEGVNACVLNLEEEKEKLEISLREAKKAEKEAEEKMRDEDKLAMSLGKEKEALEKKVKKLEEMVRTRSESEKEENPLIETTVSVKRGGNGGRRKKSDNGS